jgi:DNA-binding CsgD family transcriptional regulator/energy-coupling factor transporter ATP-binding protein EcfA2
MGAIQCRDLVGRHAELRAMTASLDRADQSGEMLFLVGEPGVGKSRLAREMAALASSRGLTVVAGRAVQAASPVPLRPIIEAAMMLARTTGIPDTPELAEYRPALASIIPDCGHPARQAAETSPLILGEAFLRLLTSMDTKGTLLVLEDLHYADPETLAVVEYLTDNVAGRRLLCLSTLRDGEPSAALDLVQAIDSRRVANLIEVRRLPDADVRRMAAACLGQDRAPEPIVRRLLASCDGLPFAVEEILAAAVSSGELVHSGSSWHVDAEVRTAIPVSLAESVRHRLARLGQPAVDVLVAAAVLGRQFDWTLLPGTVDATEQDVLTALWQAHEAQLVEPCPELQAFRFRHCLTRDAIMAGTLPPILARLAARAASEVEAAHPGLPGPWCELAAELHETAGEPARAAELVFEAGRRSLQRGALTSADASLTKARAALVAMPHADRQLLAEIEDALVLVYMLAGDCDRLVPTANRLLAELEATGASERRMAEIRLRVARALSEADCIGLAEQEVAAARALAAHTPDPALGGWADAVAARCAIDAGDTERALSLARGALATAEAAGLTASNAEAACEALDVIGRCERVRDTRAARAAFEIGYEISSRHDLPVRRIQALHELGTIEMFDGAGSAKLAEARNLAVDAGAVSTAAVLDLQLANVLSLGSELDQAQRAAERSENSAKRLKMRRVEAMAVAAQAAIAATAGDLTAAEFLAERAERLERADKTVQATTCGDARVTAALISNNLSAAVEAAESGVAHGRNEPLTAPCFVWGYWPLLEAITGSDGLAALREARKAGAEVAFWNRGCLAYAEAVLLGADGEPERADELAERGSAEFGNCAPLWNHLMHRLVAPAALRDGWGNPRAWLWDAASDLEEASYHRLASACRGLLRAVGERVPRTGRGNAAVPPQLRRRGVTSREMDVFLLIGQGRSSAEIASALHISPRTVQTHVSSLVAKNGVGSRRELVALAARQAGGDPG